MAKTLAMVFGIVYLLVGVLGFIPPLGGTTGMAPSLLLGIAPINLLHNIVHLVIGLAGVTLGRTEAGGMTFCRTFGVILIVIGLLGLVWPAGLNNFLPLKGGDVAIHVITGAILAWAGFAAATPRRAGV